MRPPCLKCKSTSVYGQGGEWACLMCGKRWPRTKQIVEPIKIKEGEEMAPIKNCRNCHREMSIVKDGLCFTCYKAVKEFVVDSEEYYDGLRKIYEYITGPDFRSTKPVTKVKFKSKEKYSNPKGKTFPSEDEWLKVKPKVELEDCTSITEADAMNLGKCNCSETPNSSAHQQVADSLIRKGENLVILGNKLKSPDATLLELFYLANEAGLDMSIRLESNTLLGA